MSDQDIRLIPLGRFPGKRVLSWHDGALYASQKYSLWRMYPGENKWEYVARFRPNWTRTVSSATRLGGRLRRDGFHALGVLPDGGLVAILPKAIALCPPGQTEFTVTWRIRRGTRPLALTVTPEGAIYWGEYFNNPDRDEVHVYGSLDGGRSWEVVYTFPEGSIRHVHSITYDPFGDHLWMCTGDHDAESRIMRVSNDWRTVETVSEGSQRTRAVRPIPTPHGLYFATDSELEQNYICCLTSDGVMEQLCPISGPGMWGFEAGTTLFFSSDVEPSKVNLDPFASMYGSRDGKSWSRLVGWRKDFWDMRLFQFGNIILPRGRNDTDILAATGMAVQGEDGVMHLWRVE